MEEPRIFQGDVFWIEGIVEETPELGAFREEGCFEGIIGRII